MSANEWDKIEFDKIPSKAGLIYKNAFARRDIIAKRYEAFAKSAETKVNAKTLFPYDVVSKAVEMKAGVVLCLIGAICLILSGITMVTSPRAADQLNAASTITISGSGVLLILCVLSMVVGFVLILRKK